MVHLLYTNTDKQLPPDTCSQLLAQLPPVCQSRIHRHIRWQDAQRSLLGLSLLMKGVKAVAGSSATLDSLVYTANGKPYLALPIQFSIAHAGQFSLCAISTTTTVGIDIEEMIDRPCADFEYQFTTGEWQLLSKERKTTQLFYTYWTKKESVVKATGEGLTADLSLIDTTTDQLTWKGKTWFWRHVPLHSNYVSYLATDNAHVPLSLEECFF